MIRLEKSDRLHREIRQDDAPELGISTWTLAREAIQAGTTGKALALMDYGCAESLAMHDTLVAWLEQVLTVLAGFGEEQVEKHFRQRYEARVKDWIALTPGVEQNLQRCAEYQRSHFSTLSIVEEPDRYVIHCDPCGSGGRLRRTRPVGLTKKAHPWSWGKAGVPLYCAHCCMFWEILPIEQRGYPIRISLLGDKPEDPCTHLYYKKPELIPEKYFERIGKTKTIR